MVFLTQKINESMLKPNLGHPNMRNKLDTLNKKEIDRQATHLRSINEFVEYLKNTISKGSNNFLKDLSNSNESLLIKFDDLLTEDDIFKPGKSFY